MAPSISNPSSVGDLPTPQSRTRTFRKLSVAQLFKALDWFVPEELRSESEDHQRARMFLISHIAGPILSIPIPLFLYYLSPKPATAESVIALCILGFWLFPFLLKLTGRVVLLSLLSVQNLTFVILWGCYHYGGLSSPFIPWLLTVPLFSFFYLGPGTRAKIIVLTIIATNLTAFALIYQIKGSFPEVIPLSQLEGIGILSTLAASIYVSLMALYYANLVASQSALEREVQRHQVTAVSLRDATQEAERANRAKSKFLAKMSHELRTPLNAIIGYSEILLEDAEAAGSEEICRDLKKINSAGQHLLNLISDVLDLSKLEAGKMEVWRERVNVAALLGAIEVQLHQEAAKRGLEFVARCDTIPGHVETDLPKFRQIVLYVARTLMNLGSRKPIELLVRSAGNRLVIHLQDNGVPHDIEYLHNLFRTFGENESETGSKYGEAKLDLALAQRLCLFLGGDISVQSADLFGNRFTISLPKTVQAESQAEPSQMRPAPDDPARIQHAAGS
jgi:signal transduction histidine kinase